LSAPRPTALSRGQDGSPSPFSFRYPQKFTFRGGYRRRRWILRGLFLPWLRRCVYSLGSSIRIQQQKMEYPLFCPFLFLAPNGGRGPSLIVASCWFCCRCLSLNRAPSLNCKILKLVYLTDRAPSLLLINAILFPVAFSWSAPSPF